jgi:phage-related protein
MRQHYQTQRLKAGFPERRKGFFQRGCGLYQNGYNQLMKPLRFLGDSLKALREFPRDARQNAGRQLYLVQDGRPPNDFKPMTPIGKGVEEIRVRDESGSYRIIYTARMTEAVYVLHVFLKETQTTSKTDVEIARSRFQELMRGRK